MTCNDIEVSHKGEHFKCINYKENTTGINL